MMYYDTSWVSQKQNARGIFHSFRITGRVEQHPIDATQFCRIGEITLTFNGKECVAFDYEWTTIHPLEIQVAAHLRH